MMPDAHHDAQALLDVLPLASYVYVLDSGLILGANAAVCDLFGYTLQQLRAMPAPDLYAADERDAMRRLMHTLPPEGSGDRRLQTSDGTVLRARVRYRNSEFMSRERQFLRTRLVVILSSQPEGPAPQLETVPPETVQSGHAQ
jgi:PAS domain S-box-containing protein